MFYISEFGSIVEITRTAGGYELVIYQGEGFYRTVYAGSTAAQCRAFIKFHFGGV